MLRKMTYIFIILVGDLIATPVSDHFKIPMDKSSSHQMKGIDFIYMINLDERPEKYNRSMDQLAPYGIVPYRFSAVNGWELTLESLNTLGVEYQPWMRQQLMGTCYLPEDQGEPRHEILQVPGRNYYCHCMSRGAIGIALSHLSVLNDAYNSGYETIWVMEDDIQVIQDPHLLSDLIENMDIILGKEGWDILFTDFDTKNQRGEYVPCMGAAFRPNFSPVDNNRFLERIDISLDFRKIGARYGAYSMIVRRSAMKKILDFMLGGIFLPYDMEFPLPEGIRMYTVRKDIVSTQPNALSDNGAPNYKQNLIEPSKK